MNDLKNIVLRKLELDNILNWNSDLGSSYDDDFIYVGWIAKYDFLRGYGIVADLINNEEHFFHITEVGDDLFTCYNINIRNTVLDHLLFQLRFNYERIGGCKKCKKEMKDKDMNKMEISLSCRFGTYKLLFLKNRSYPEITKHNLSGYPYIAPGQIICFKIKDGKAFGIHNPFFYKFQLLKNRDIYSSATWNLLFNYIPSLLYTIQYQSVYDLERELSFFREKAKPFIEQIKQFDIAPYKNLDNYSIRLKSSCYPTVKDSDPNELYLEISRNKELNDEFVTHSTFCVTLTGTVEYYGNAPMEYLQHFVYDEYKKEFDDFYKEYKTYSKEHNFDYQSLIEKHFLPVKKKEIEYYISKYSEAEHLAYYLRKLKYDFIRNLKDKCCLGLKIIKPDFFDDGDYIFEFEKSLPYYGHKIEIIHKKDIYQLYTYDESYKGYYKGKHYIGQMYFTNQDADYTMLFNKDINTELYSYIDNQFEKVITDCIEELKK